MEKDAVICDSILEYLTSAHRFITRSDFYDTSFKEVVDLIYNTWRDYLKAGDLKGWEKSYEYYSGKQVDVFDELVDSMFFKAGLGDEGTYDQFCVKVGMFDNANAS